MQCNSPVTNRGRNQVAPAVSVLTRDEIAQFVQELAQPPPASDPGQGTLELTFRVIWVFARG